jgi:hypothetical protein
MIETGIAAWGQGDGRRLAFQSYKELTLDIAASIFVGAPQGGRLESRPTRSGPQAQQAPISKPRDGLPVTFEPLA